MLHRTYYTADPRNPAALGVGLGASSTGSTLPLSVTARIYALLAALPGATGRDQDIYTPRVAKDIAIPTERGAPRVLVLNRLQLRPDAKSPLPPQIAGWPHCAVAAQ